MSLAVFLTLMFLSHPFSIKELRLSCHLKVHFIWGSISDTLNPFSFLGPSNTALNKSPSALFYTLSKRAKKYRKRAVSNSTEVITH